MGERAEAVKHIKKDAELAEQIRHLDRRGIMALRDTMRPSKWHRLYEKWLELRKASRRQSLGRKVAYRKREKQLKTEGWQTTRQVALNRELSIELTRRMLRKGVEKRLWRCEVVGKRLWWTPTSRNKRGRLPPLG